MTDLHVAVDTFAALIVMEAIVKPVAIALGRWVLARVDRVLRVIPDWLYK